MDRTFTEYFSRLKNMLSNIDRSGETLREYNRWYDYTAIRIWQDSMKG